MMVGMGVWMVMPRGETEGTEGWQEGSWCSVLSPEWQWDAGLGRCGALRSWGWRPSNTTVPTAGTPLRGW